MDLQQFKKEFDRLYLPLCLFSLRLLNVREDAEDVVQECFSVMWNKLSQGEEIDNFKAYIYRAVRNQSLMHLRKSGMETEVDLEMSGDEVDEEAVDTSERDARLWRAINRLPDRCREVFLLSKRDGLSHKEISLRLDISVKTIENQMSKAFSRLREELQPKGRKVFFLPFL